MNRSEIDSKYKWSISDLYESESAWEKDFELLNKELDKFGEFQGKLGESGDVLAACLKHKDKVSEIMERLYVYAHMKHHEDSTLPLYQGLSDRSESLAVKLNYVLSFLEPEILSIDRKNLDLFIMKTKDLQLYRHYLDDLLRLAEHILSPELEAVLANAHEIGAAPDNIYSMINDADIRFGKVKNEEGQEEELTHGKFISFLESPDRDVRYNTFHTFYDAYLKQKNTLAATYSSSVKSDIFFSKTRKYPSALEASLASINVPKDVYTNLISTVHDNLPAMHEYIRIRKKLLGLSEIHMYDLYTPIVPEANTNISYPQAQEKVLKSLKVLGQEYVDKAKEGFEKGWVDVFENEGKRSGAYSWGAYGCHPFILMNFDNKINDMFTLAHEMGHAMHSYYSWATQPYVYSEYSIFLAEVASTVNEVILSDYLLNDSPSKTERDYLINQYLEQFRGTVFRQTMFAEFEMLTHQMAEAGEPLTYELLCKTYHDLNVKYYGRDIIIDEKIDIEWARIPHFYSAFYVYQYATGFSAAVALGEKLINGSGVSAYIDFLKGGSRDYPINLLKAAGVDLSTPQPISDALGVFKKLLREFE